MIAAAALIIAGCNSPAHVIKPVIYVRAEDKYRAMKSAPVIVVAEVLDYKLVAGPRDVERPADTFNPKAWMVPLHLARMSAKVILSLRGDVRGPIQFYSWVWASGQHGGERLFRPYPGYCHILFLREEGGYLRTVADYPAYDLEIPPGWLPAIISGLQSSSENGSDLFERIVTVLIKAELESAGGIGWNYVPRGMDDLTGLTGEFYVASQLDSFCLHLANRFGRFAACEGTAGLFYGRCEAYRLARAADSAGVEATHVTQARARCEAQEVNTIGWLRTNNWSLPPGGGDYGWSPSAGRRRLAVRLYASAMDANVRTAACAAAATMPEARDIPECDASGNNGIR
jgi:hypothetical protein